MNKHEWWNYERVVNNESWMIMNKLIIKLRETTWNDVSIIVLEWLWMSSEQSWMDYKILAYF